MPPPSQTYGRNTQKTVLCLVLVCHILGRLPVPVNCIWLGAPCPSITSYQPTRPPLAIYLPHLIPPISPHALPFHLPSINSPTDPPTHRSTHASDPSIHPSIRIHSSIHPSTHIYPSTHLPIHPPLQASTHPPTYPPTYPPTHVSTRRGSDLLGEEALKQCVRVWRAYVRACCAFVWVWPACVWV